MPEAALGARREVDTGSQKMLCLPRMRWISRLLIALVVLTAAPRPAHGKETVLRFCYWANYVENQFFLQVSESFERQNPGVKVKREWYVGDYGPKLQLVLITGKASDVILMDDEVFPRYGVRGYLEDLRPYIERRSDDIERGSAGADACAGAADSNGWWHAFQSVPHLRPPVTAVFGAQHSIAVTSGCAAIARYSSINTGNPASTWSNSSITSRLRMRTQPCERGSPMGSLSGQPCM